MHFDWSVVWDAIPNLLDGTRMTLMITFWGLLGGVVLGAIAGVVRAYGPKWLSVLAQGLSLIHI